MSRALIVFIALLLLAAPAAAEGPGFALRCFGTGSGDIDRVKIQVDVVGESSTPTTPVNVGNADFTIELWMRPIGTNNGTVSAGPSNGWINGNIFIDHDRFGQNRSFGASLGSGQVCFGIIGADDAQRTICGTTDIRDGAWHHVAITRQRSDGALAVYVDGAQEATASAANGPDGDVSYPDDATPCSNCCGGGNCNFSDPYLVLCAEKHDAGGSFPSFSGQIDELRVSSSIRYTGTFTRPSAPFIPDASTIALYHFDESTGTAARDVMDGRNHGVLSVGGPDNGPTWVSSTAPLGGSESFGRTILRRLFGP